MASEHSGPFGTRFLIARERHLLDRDGDEQELALGSDEIEESLSGHAACDPVALVRTLEGVERHEGVQVDLQRGSSRATNQEERIMLRKRLAAMLASFFFTAITGAAFAAPPASGPVDTAEKAGKLGEALNVLHAVGQWSIDLSKMADTRAKSDLVKNYAREMATANAEKDAKLMAIAQKNGIEVAPLNPQTEEGKSLLDRSKAETALLSSLSGDAFDKEFMTLVTNTQQSVIHFLEGHKAAATDPDVKQFLGDLKTTVQNRLKTAQDIMAKVYGDRI